MKRTLIATALALASTLAVSAAPTGEPAEVICHKIRGTGGYEKEYKPDRTWCNPGPMSPYLGACRVTIIWVDEATWTAMSCVYNAVD